MPAHLSEREMADLIERADEDSPLGRRDRAILELFYASGLRLSELAGLDLDDVNLSARMVRVLGKGGKERLVPFNASTASALRAYLKDRDLIRADARTRRPGSLRAAGRESQSADVGAREGRRHARPRDPVFVNYRGTRLGVRSIDRLVRRHVTASGARTASARTRSGTRSRPTCSSAGPTCGRSRSCSAMRGSARRSGTRT